MNDFMQYMISIFFFFFFSVIFLFLSFFFFFFLLIYYFFFRKFDSKFSKIMVRKKDSHHCVLHKV
jgi:hypothetical protein